MHDKLEDLAGQLNRHIPQLNSLLETTSTIQRSDDLDRIYRDLNTIVEEICVLIDDIQWAHLNQRIMRRTRHARK